MFSFLKSKHNGVTVLDPTEPNDDITQFLTEDWSKSPYGCCKEDAPYNSPKRRGTCISMRDFVDSNHDGDSVTN